MLFQINFILKQTIREPRPHPPDGARDSKKLWEQFGMPSSHSQFMWYFAVYATLFVAVRLHHQVQVLAQNTGQVRYLNVITNFYEIIDEHDFTTCELRLIRITQACW